MHTFYWFHHINLKYFHESVMYNVRSPHPPRLKNKTKHGGKAQLAKLELYNDKDTIINTMYKIIG